MSDLMTKFNCVSKKINLFRKNWIASQTVFMIPSEWLFTEIGYYYD